MKIIPRPFFATVLFLSAFTYRVSAQQDQLLTLSAPPANIVIDGDIKEWGDSLRYYDAGKHLNYTLANSKDTLYMAIRLKNRVDQVKVLRSGFTLTIDPKGKKKETFSITFPLNLQGNNPLNSANPADAGTDVSQQDREELQRERITTLRGIKVSGFKEVEDEMITTSNTYGFRAAVNYDQDGYLACEAAIPLIFFHADTTAKNEWAFNFKINGVERKPGARQGGAEEEASHSRGGMGGGGMGGGHHGGRGGGNRGQSTTSGNMGEMGKSENFWVKFYLAK